MAVASLIISILALLAAASAVWYGRSQAQAGHAQAVATRDQAKAEADQLYDSRHPILDAEIEDMRPSNWHRLNLTLRSGHPLVGLTARIIEGNGVTFDSNTDGVAYSETEPPKTAVWGKALHKGDVARWRVLLADERSEKISLRIECVGEGYEGQPWTETVTVEVPGCSAYADGGDLLVV